MLNIAVLVSGGGTNLQALLDSEARGENPNGRITLVVASKPGVYALERAAKAGVEGCVVRRKDYASSEDFDAALLKTLKDHNIDLVVLAGFLAGDPTITLASVVALSLGIAIQNVPEGAVVSLPLTANGMSRPKAFLAGTLCGAVEPVGAVLMVAITGLVTPLLPVVLAFAAGAMMYVVTEELIPQTQQGRHTNIGTIGVAFGFVLMMVLDVALG